MALAAALTETLMDRGPCPADHESRQNWRPLLFAKFFSLVANATSADDVDQEERARCRAQEDVQDAFKVVRSIVGYSLKLIFLGSRTSEVACQLATTVFALGCTG